MKLRSKLDLAVFWRAVNKSTDVVLQNKNEVSGQGLFPTAGRLRCRFQKELHQNLNAYPPLWDDLRGIKAGLHDLQTALREYAYCQPHAQDVTCPPEHFWPGLACLHSTSLLSCQTSARSQPGLAWTSLPRFCLETQTFSPRSTTSRDGLGMLSGETGVMSRQQLSVKIFVAACQEAGLPSF